MIPASTQIAMYEAKSEVDKKTEGDLIVKLQTAMNSTRNHWVVTDEEEQFRAAIGAVMLHYGEGSEEYKRLAWEIKQIQRLGAIINAAQLGISVDISSITEDEEQYEVIGLMKIWKELKGE